MNPDYHITEMDTQATLDKKEEIKRAILTNLGEDMKNIPLRELNLSIRTCNCLTRAGYNTIGDLAVTDPEKIKTVRNLGAKSFAEMQGILRGCGLWK